MYITNKFLDQLRIYNQPELPLMLFVQTEVLKYLRLVQLFARSNTWLHPPTPGSSTKGNTLRKKNQ